MKKNSLKDSMKGGLNGLLSPTAPAAKQPVSSTEEQPEPAAKPSKIIEPTQEPKKREPAVHCNFVIDKSIHTRMKYLAIDLNKSLRDIVNEAMSEYLEKHER